MSAGKPAFSSMGFAKTFVLPCLLIFLVPIAGLAFFLHAQNTFDSQARETALQQIRNDATLKPAEREKAIEFFSKVPFSRLMKDDRFAAQFDGMTRFNYATFRWMIRLSALSILASVVVFALVGVCVLLSLSSQRSQYLSLSIGWQVLRLYGAFQIVVQGALVIALSYWVTALSAHRFYPKLILAAGVLAVVGIIAVLAAIFKRIDVTCDVEGTPLEPQGSERFFEELQAICRKVDTAAPDQVIVGIDDNFFVTEVPVRVGGKTLNGRTLFASLSLLKQLHVSEADGVLAHEFSAF